jgi:SAM-dependent methyltransferase
LRFQVASDWSFEPESFDFIVSNQVLEHVSDKAAFFRNVYRSLKNRGYSFHLAPLRHCVHEGHIWIPFAHRLQSFDALVGYIKFFSSLGIGKYPIHRRDTGVSIEDYSRRHADYMLFCTSYASQSETLAAARKAGLRGDFRYTWHFYALKLRQILRLKPPCTYPTKTSALRNGIAIRLLRYVSSVTLTLQKANDY